MIRQRLQDSLASGDTYPPLFQVRSFVQSLETVLVNQIGIESPLPIKK